MSEFAGVELAGRLRGSAVGQPARLHAAGQGVANGLRFRECLTYEKSGQRGDIQVSELIKTLLSLGRLLPISDTFARRRDGSPNIFANAEGFNDKPQSAGSLDALVP